MSAHAVAFDLGRCLSDLRADAEAKKRIKAGLLATADGIIAELAGPAYVGRERCQRIAVELLKLRDEIETL